jgi:hypothetical protein
MKIIIDVDKLKELWIGLKSELDNQIPDAILKRSYREGIDKIISKAIDIDEKKIVSFMSGAIHNATENNRKTTMGDFANSIMKIFRRK